jgi:hypothetical protein
MSGFRSESLQTIVSVNLPALGNTSQNARNLTTVLQVSQGQFADLIFHTWATHARKNTAAAVIPDRSRCRNQSLLQLSREAAADNKRLSTHQF